MVWKQSDFIESQIEMFCLHIDYAKGIPILSDTKNRDVNNWEWVILKSTIHW